MKSSILKLANVIGQTGLFRFLRPNRIPVFMLHRVRDIEECNPGDTPTGSLREYLRYLADQDYRVLTMEELWGILDQGNPVPAKSVMFTIDDGFYDHHDVAAKVFDEFGFPLNFFVITGLLDRHLWPWDDQITYALSRTEAFQANLELPSGRVCLVDLQAKGVRQAVRDLRKVLKSEKQEKIYDWLRAELYQKVQVEFPSSIPEEYRPMSWQDARSLKARGHGVYPHTFSHRILSTLSPDEKRQEIHVARKRIEQELGFVPEVFAYPTGRLSDYDAADIAELKRVGFKMAFNTVPAYVGPSSCVYELPRFSLPGDLIHFIQIVNRLEALKEKIPGQPNFSQSSLPTR